MDLKVEDVRKLADEHRMMAQVCDSMLLYYKELELARKEIARLKDITGEKPLNGLVKSTDEILNKKMVTAMAMEHLK